MEKAEILKEKFYSSTIFVILTSRLKFKIYIYFCLTNRKMNDIFILIMFAKIKCHILESQKLPLVLSCSNNIQRETINKNMLPTYQYV